jgi:hypothetical protein
MTMLLLSYFSIAQIQSKINISADIRGRSCGGGLGLCSANAISEKTNSTVSAQKIGDTTVLFIIDKAGLSVENQKSLVGKELYKVLPTEKIDFKQETNVLFDNKTLVNLGFDPRYATIKTGIYPMIIEKDKILVTFTLSEKL